MDRLRGGSGACRDLFHFTGAVTRNTLSLPAQASRSLVATSDRRRGCLPESYRSRPGEVL